MRKRTVVVTGLGVVSPGGVGVSPFWESVAGGVLSTRRVSQFSPEGLCSDQAGEVPCFDAAPGSWSLQGRSQQRATHLSVAACREAFMDAGFGGDDLSRIRERARVVMGAVVANRPSLEVHLRALFCGDIRLEDVDFATHDVSWVAEAPSLDLGLRGGAVVLPTACTAGNNAIALGMEFIRYGRADVVIAGGADELSPAMFTMFSRFNSLAPDVVRPFDRHRKGLILSEGAGALVLEGEEHARARRARIYGCIAGYGNFADAHDMTHPHPQGVGAELAMRTAMRDAGLELQDIQYISAHGTGTIANDGIEARAVRNVFGGHADSLSVSSIKSMLGHTQGAASAIEAISCLLAIRDSLVPPTTNHEETDPDCPINLVRNQARHQQVRATLNNGFGFGGNACCLAITGY